MKRSQSPRARVDIQGNLLAVHGMLLCALSETISAVRYTNLQRFYDGDGTAVWLTIVSIDHAVRESERAIKILKGERKRLQDLRKQLTTRSKRSKRS